MMPVSEATTIVARCVGAVLRHAPEDGDDLDGDAAERIGNAIGAETAELSRDSLRDLVVMFSLIAGQFVRNSSITGRVDPEVFLRHADEFARRARAEERGDDERG